MSSAPIRYLAPLYLFIFFLTPYKQSKRIPVASETNNHIISWIFFQQEQQSSACILMLSYLLLALCMIVFLEIYNVKDVSSEKTKNTRRRRVPFVAASKILYDQFYRHYRSSPANLNPVALQGKLVAKLRCAIYPDKVPDIGMVQGPHRQQWWQQLNYGEQSRGGKESYWDCHSLLEEGTFQEIYKRKEGIGLLLRMRTEWSANFTAQD